MIEVKFTHTGRDRLARRINQRARYYEDLREPLKKLGEQAIDGFKERIETLNPGDVQDLKEKTKKQKARQVGFIYPILKRTGEMMRSMYSYIHLAKRGMISIQVRFRGAKNKAKAQAHNEGTATLPKREWMRLPRNWSREVFAAIRAGRR